MGVKDLWGILAPVKKPIALTDLRGQTLAVDLSIWIVETQGVKQMQGVVVKPHLRNLFFRINHLLQLGINLVFVIEGEPPQLKYDTMAQRNQTRYPGGGGGWRGRGRGGRGGATGSGVAHRPKRTQFKAVLRECCQMLDEIGVPYVQAAGEAEAMCALLDYKGVVDACITNDGDAFLYGARRVYRNFTMDSKDPHVECYLMSDVEEQLKLYRQSLVGLALILGCDYLPKGIPGVGKESALKFFSYLGEEDILERFDSWLTNQEEFEALDRAASKKKLTHCAHCKHPGTLRQHDKDGCKLCGITWACLKQPDDHPCPCDWHQEQKHLADKLIEYNIQKKAVKAEGFPWPNVVKEFLRSRDKVPPRGLSWKRPQLVTFILYCERTLEWVRDYSRKKILPLLTLWDMKAIMGVHGNGHSHTLLQPQVIVKSRVRQGVPCYEISWNKIDADTDCADEYYTTIEEADIFSKCFPQIREAYEFEKAAKAPAKKRGKAKSKTSNAENKENLAISEVSTDLGNLQLRKETEGKNEEKENSFQSLEKPTAHIKAFPLSESGNGIRKSLDGEEGAEDVSDEGSHLSSSGEEVEEDDDFAFMAQAIERGCCSSPDEKSEGSSDEMEEDPSNQNEIPDGIDQRMEKNGIKKEDSSSEDESDDQFIPLGLRVKHRILSDAKLNTNDILEVVDSSGDNSNNTDRYELSSTPYAKPSVNEEGNDQTTKEKKPLNPSSFLVKTRPVESYKGMSVICKSRIKSSNLMEDKEFDERDGVFRDIDLDDPENNVQCGFGNKSPKIDIQVEALPDRVIDQDCSTSSNKTTDSVDRMEENGDVAKKGKKGKPKSKVTKKGKKAKSSTAKSQGNKSKKPWHKVSADFSSDEDEMLQKSNTVPMINTEDFIQNIRHRLQNEQLKKEMDCKDSNQGVIILDDEEQGNGRMSVRNCTSVSGMKMEDTLVVPEEECQHVMKKSTSKSKDLATSNKYDTFRFDGVEDMEGATTVLIADDEIILPSPEKHRKSRIFPSFRRTTEATLPLVDGNETLVLSSTMISGTLENKTQSNVQKRDRRLQDDTLQIEETSLNYFANPDLTLKLAESTNQLAEYGQVSDDKTLIIDTDSTKILHSVGSFHPSQTETMIFDQENGMDSTYIPRVEDDTIMTETLKITQFNSTWNPPDETMVVEALDKETHRKQQPVTQDDVTFQYNDERTFVFQGNQSNSQDGIRGENSTVCFSMDETQTLHEICDVDQTTYLFLTDSEMAVDNGRSRDKDILPGGFIPDESTMCLHDTGPEDTTLKVKTSQIFSNTLTTTAGIKQGFAGGEDTVLVPPSEVKSRPHIDRQCSEYIENELSILLDGSFNFDETVNFGNVNPNYQEPQKKMNLDTDSTLKIQGQGNSSGDTQSESCVTLDLDETVISGNIIRKNNGSKLNVPNHTSNRFQDDEIGAFDDTVISGNLTSVKSKFKAGPKSKFLSLEIGKKAVNLDSNSIWGTTMSDSLLTNCLSSTLMESKQEKEMEDNVQSQTENSTLTESFQDMPSVEIIDTPPLLVATKRKEDGPNAAEGTPRSTCGKTLKRNYLYAGLKLNKASPISKKCSRQSDLPKNTIQEVSKPESAGNFNIDTSLLDFTIDDGRQPGFCNYSTSRVYRETDRDGNVQLRKVTLHSQNNELQKQRKSTLAKVKVNDKKIGVEDNPICIDISSDEEEIEEKDNFLKPARFLTSSGNLHGRGNLPGTGSGNLAGSPMVTCAIYSPQPLAKRLMTRFTHRKDPTGSVLSKLSASERAQNKF